MMKMKLTKSLFFLPLVLVCSCSRAEMEVPADGGVFNEPPKGEEISEEKAKSLLFSFLEQDNFEKYQHGFYYVHQYILDSMKLNYWTRYTKVQEFDCSISTDAPSETTIYCDKTSGLNHFSSRSYGSEKADGSKTDQHISSYFFEKDSKWYTLDNDENGNPQTGHVFNYFNINFWPRGNYVNFHPDYPLWGTLTRQDPNYLDSNLFCYFGSYIHEFRYRLVFDQTLPVYEYLYTHRYREITNPITGVREYPDKYIETNSFDCQRFDIAYPDLTMYQITENNFYQSKTTEHQN